MARVRIASRRAFLRLGMLGLGGLGAASWTMGVEPERLVTRHIRLSESPTQRIVHFTDTHHKGRDGYLRRVVDRINELDADFICFTGDLVEEADYVDEALDIIGAIRKPMFGVPGNHDYSSGASFEAIRACFEATGGRWLEDEWCDAPGGGMAIVGRANARLEVTRTPDKPLLLLTHYPDSVEEFGERSFVLALAGHSHGGQVRVPLYGPLILPRYCDLYNLGLYDTPRGPLFVSAGVGTWMMRLRLFCPPDVAVIEL